MREPRTRRPHGHAALAAQARHALGIRGEIHGLNDVPLPLMHAALGMAACALAFLVRVPALGVRNGAIAAMLLALATGAGLFLYDRAVYGAGRAAAGDGVALPVAALGAFSIVLAASTSLWVRLAYALLIAAVIGWMPVATRSDLHGGTAARMSLLRDIGGIATAAPFALAAVSADVLPLWCRLPIVAAGFGLIAHDAFRLEAVAPGPARRAALACAAVGVVATVLAGAGTLSSGAAAGLLVVAWYGVRGFAASMLAGRRGVLLVLEYLGVVVVALLALVGSGALH